MRKWLLLILVLLLCQAGCDSKNKEASKVKENALALTIATRGLPAKITIRVCDPDGNPVPDASVMFAFTFDNADKPNISKGKTDANGMATGEGRANDTVVIHVDKPGWYKPYAEYSFWGPGKGCESGRWEPWNPTLDITLYPHLHPRWNQKIKMCSYENLSLDTVYGFDMMKNSIVLPGEKNATADFLFKGDGCWTRIYGEDWRDSKTIFTNSFEVVFSNEFDGVVQKAARKDSQFRLTYLAPETGYERKIKFYEDDSRQLQKDRGRPFPTDDEYFIFRISRKEEDSAEVKRYYGVIIRINAFTTRKGDLTFGVDYFLNQEPDDRNIEYR